MNLVPLEQLTFESFAGLLKSRLRVWIEGQPPLELELSDITPRRIPPTGGTNSQTLENFSLIFRGPTDRLLPQQIYWFESPSIGRFELFIVPSGRDSNGIQYQATFNRLVKAH